MEIYCMFTGFGNIHNITVSELQENLETIHSSNFLTQLDMELFTSHKNPTSEMN